MIIIYERDIGGLGQRSSRGRGEKWQDFGFILEKILKGLLEIGNEVERDIKSYLSFWFE